MSLRKLIFYFQENINWGEKKEEKTKFEINWINVQDYFISSNIGWAFYGGAIYGQIIFIQLRQLQKLQLQLHRVLLDQLQELQLVNPMKYMFMVFVIFVANTIIGKVEDSSDILVHHRLELLQLQQLNQRHVHLLLKLYAPCMIKKKYL